MRSGAVELVELYPGELVRFLMLRTHPKRAIEFDPAGNSLPRLLDEYDRCAEAFAVDPESDLGKVWKLSQISADAGPAGFVVRFSVVASWIQIPSIDPAREAGTLKGTALTTLEHADLDARIALARVWLERWAPDEARYSVAATLPEAAAALTDAQRVFLGRARDEIGRIVDAEAMQERLYEIAKEVGLVTAEGKVSRDAFAALYLAFIGKPNGPRAAWLLVTLDPVFVTGRLAEAAAQR